MQHDPPPLLLVWFAERDPIGAALDRSLRRLQYDAAVLAVGKVRSAPGALAILLGAALLIGGCGGGSSNSGLQSKPAPAAIVIASANDSRPTTSAAAPTPRVQSSGIAEYLRKQSESIPTILSMVPENAEMVDAFASPDAHGSTAAPLPARTPNLNPAARQKIRVQEIVNTKSGRVQAQVANESPVPVPAGVTAGQQIRLKGQGETAPGHRPGDLLITVAIAPHPFFKVDGSDLRVDLPITLYEAVLGGKVRVPTLGSAVDLTIPKNTSSGRIFRLKGKGLPKGAGATGDLFITTRIMLPDGNDAELEALMQKWRDTHPYNPRSDVG